VVHARRASAKGFFEVSFVWDEGAGVCVCGGWGGGGGGGQRIPERVVHARGASANGLFEVRGWVGGWGVYASLRGSCVRGRVPGLFG
jgi:hypothetical protein